MRIEYVIVGFILILIVLGVLLAMLSGVVPSFDSVLDLINIG